MNHPTTATIAAGTIGHKKTVETHLRNIFNKTGLATRVALARAAEGRDRVASA